MESFASGYFSINAVLGIEKFVFGREKDMMSSLFGSDDGSSSGNDDDNVVPEIIIAENGGTPFTSDISATSVKLFERLGIAHQLWPVAKLMCNYLDENSHLLSKHTGGSINILELGAGVGLCGLFATAALQHQKYNVKITVVLTNLPEALEGLNENISLNGLIASVASTELSWGVHGHMERVFAMFDSPPLAIAADCVYYQSLFRSVLYS